MDGAKADQLAFRRFIPRFVERILLGFLAFCLWLHCGLNALEADERRENLNALLASLDSPAQFVPRAHTRHVRGCGLLSRYQKDVAKAVGVKSRHCAEILGENFTVSAVELLNEKLNVCGYELLDGFSVAFGVGVVVAGKFHFFERRPEEGGRTRVAAR